jgi:glycosyltransferase involved in cell wall biosynthesis
VIRVLHVVATGQRRGAEVFASDLVRALGDTGDLDQEVAVLRGPWPPAVGFDAPVDRMRIGGPRLPGVRMDARTLANLRSTLRRFRPDVVQAHGGEALKHSILAGAARRVPVVYRRIAEASPEAHRTPRRVVHSVLARRASRIVAVADAIRDETVRTFRIPSRRVITIPRGIDPRRVDPSRSVAETDDELAIGGGAPVVMWLGALSAEKDPFAFLEIVAELRREDPRLVALLVGDGPLRADVARAVERLSLRDSVRQLGLRFDIGDLLAASDALLLTSRTEGMPGCVIEAGMAGVPVVAFDVGGVREVICDGVTGLLVPPGDRRALRKLTMKVLADEAFARALGDEARSRCRATYGIDGIAKRYVDIYHEVLAR